MDRYIKANDMNRADNHLKTAGDIYSNEGDNSVDVADDGKAEATDCREMPDNADRLADESDDDEKSRFILHGEKRDSVPDDAAGDAAYDVADDAADQQVTDDESLMQDSGWAWLVTLGCCLAHLITGGLERSDGIFFLRMTSRFGQNAQTTAWAGALAGTVMLSMGPLASAFSNRFSARTCVMCGALINAVGLVCSGLAPDMITLIVCYGLVQGFGRGLSYTPGLITVGTYFSRRRGLAVGLSTAGVGLGTLVMPPLVEVLFDHYGFQGAFLVLGGLVLNLCVVAMLYRPLFVHRNIVLGGRRRAARKREEALLSEVVDDSNVCPPLFSPVGTSPSSEGKGEVRFRPGRENGLSTSVTVESNSNIGRYVPCVSDENGEDCRRNGNCCAASVTKAGSLSTGDKDVEMGVFDDARDGCDLPYDIFPEDRDEAQFCQKNDHDQEHSVGNVADTRHPLLPPKQPDSQTLQADGLEPEGDSQQRQAVGRTEPRPLVPRDFTPTASTKRKDSTPTVGNGRRRSVAVKRFVRSSITTCFPTDRGSNRGAKRKVLDWALLKKPAFLFYCFSICLYTFSMKSAIVFFPPLVKSKGVPERDAAFLLSISGILDSVGRVAMGVLLELRPVRPFRPLVFNGLLFAVAAVCFVAPFFSSFAEFVVIFGLFGVLTGSYVSQKSVVLTDLVGVHRLGSSFGFLLFFQGVGNCIGPPVSGVLRDAFGQYMEVFLLGGGSLALSGLLMLVSNLCHARATRSSSQPPS